MVGLKFNFRICFYAEVQSSLDAFAQILKNEGARSLFKEAGANILLILKNEGSRVGFLSSRFQRLGNEKISHLREASTYPTNQRFQNSW
ncbi:unnamed protein product [Coffea canephora]|uniref:DH200=94 genomic scaffold, scaffold_7651 n=1 Tax=Coffea canephora TaxID=49390 RepID=A0A068VMH6_COFCA|nr:unnamed protein product [Coffea canephora]